MRLGPAACSVGAAVFFLAIGPSEGGYGANVSEGTSVDVSNIINVRAFKKVGSSWQMKCGQLGLRCDGTTGT